MENEGDVLKQACKSIRKFSAQNEVLRIPAPAFNAWISAMAFDAKKKHSLAVLRSLAASGKRRVLPAGKNQLFL